MFFKLINFFSPTVALGLAYLHTMYKKPKSENERKIMFYKSFIEFYVGTVNLVLGISLIIQTIRSKETSCPEVRMNQMNLAVIYIAFGLVTVAISNNEKTTIKEYILVANMYMTILFGMFILYFVKMIKDKKVSKNAIYNLSGNIFVLLKLLKETHTISGNKHYEMMFLRLF